MRQAVGELVVAALVARAPDVRDEVVGDAVELARVVAHMARLQQALAQRVAEPLPLLRLAASTATTHRQPRRSSAQQHHTVNHDARQHSTPHRQPYHSCLRSRQLFTTIMLTIIHGVTTEDCLVTAYSRGDCVLTR